MLAIVFTEALLISATAPALEFFTTVAPWEVPIYMLNSIADIAEFIAVIIESGLTVEELNQALGVFNEIMIGDLYRLSHRLYQFSVFGFLTETQTRLLGELTARATAELFVVGSFVDVGNRTISIASMLLLCRVFTTMPKKSKYQKNKNFKERKP